MNVYLCVSWYVQVCTMIYTPAASNISRNRQCPREAATQGNDWPLEILFGSLPHVSSFFTTPLKPFWTARYSAVDPSASVSVVHAPASLRIWTYLYVYQCDVCNNWLLKGKIAPEEIRLLFEQVAGREKERLRTTSTWPFCAATRNGVALSLNFLVFGAAFAWRSWRTTATLLCVAAQQSAVLPNSSRTSTFTSSANNLSTTASSPFSAASMSVVHAVLPTHWQFISISRTLSSRITVMVWPRLAAMSNGVEPSDERLLMFTPPFFSILSTSEACPSSLAK